MLLMFILLLLLFCLYKTTYSLSIPDSMPKPVAIADTKEIGKFIENPHVTRVVFPLTGMDGSVPNFTFNFRLYSFIHTDILNQNTIDVTLFWYPKK